MKKRIIEIAVKMLVAALTAFLTAITTTSCMGYGPYKLRAAGSETGICRSFHLIDSSSIDKNH